MVVDGAFSNIKREFKIIMYVSFNIKRGFHHLGDSCSNVLNKINIISASGLWGINVSAIRKIEGSLVKLKGN